MNNFLKKTFLLCVHKVWITMLKLKGAQIGEKTWILVNLPKQAGLDPEKLQIGNRCVICSKAVLLCGDANRLLLKRRWEPNRQEGCSDKYDGIVIKDNCFIGIGAIIMNGVSIGPNAIVGAGAVVFNDVKPNTCVAGNPGRFICSLDTYAKVSGNMDIEGYNELSLNRENKREFLSNYFWNSRASNGDIP